MRCENHGCPHQAVKFIEMCGKPFVHLCKFHAWRAKTILETGKLSFQVSDYV